jgi:hypothetical protein
LAPFLAFAGFISFFRKSVARKYAAHWSGAVVFLGFYKSQADLRRQTAFGLLLLAATCPILPQEPLQVLLTIVTARLDGALGTRLWRDGRERLARTLATARSGGTGNRWQLKIPKVLGKEGPR